MKIFISLIMPTKDTYLNSRANEFNKYLIQMADKYSNMFVISHDCLVDSHGFLARSFGRFQYGLPSDDDIVHLGPECYRRFVNNTKDCIISKRRKNASINIVPYKRVKPLISPPASRTTPPYPVRTPWPPPPYPNPFGRLGFPPLPRPAVMPSAALHGRPSPTPFPPPPRRSFSGDYRDALIRPNYHLANPSINDGYQY